MTAYVSRRNVSSPRPQLLALRWQLSKSTALLSLSFTSGPNMSRFANATKGALAHCFQHDLVLSSMLMGQRKEPMQILA